MLHRMPAQIAIPRLLHLRFALLPSLMAAAVLGHPEQHPRRGRRRRRAQGRRPLRRAGRAPAGHPAHRPPARLPWPGRRPLRPAPLRPRRRPLRPSPRPDLSARSPNSARPHAAGLTVRVAQAAGVKEEEGGGHAVQEPDGRAPPPQAPQRPPLHAPFRRAQDQQDGQDSDSWGHDRLHEGAAGEDQAAAGGDGAAADAGRAKWELFFSDWSEDITKWDCKEDIVPTHYSEVDSGVYTIQFMKNWDGNMCVRDINEDCMDTLRMEILMDILTLEANLSSPPDFVKELLKQCSDH